MNKRTCTLITMHLAIIAGITTGYLCMYKEIKKSKQNCLDN